MSIELVDTEEGNEQPLTPNEEEKLKAVREEKILEQLETLRDRVLIIKSVIEEDNFIEIYIKPIKGNIERIKVELETVEKPRELAEMQGSLKAYRKMLHFPETAVSQLEEEIRKIQRDMPLFYTGNDLVKKCSRIRFDKQQYKIFVD